MTLHVGEGKGGLNGAMAVSRGGEKLESRECGRKERFT